MKGFEVEGRCSDNKAEECPFRKAKLAKAVIVWWNRNGGTFRRRAALTGHPATWSSPHSPCALAGYLKRVGSFRPAFFLIFRAPRKSPAAAGLFSSGKVVGAQAV